LTAEQLAAYDHLPDNDRLRVLMLLLNGDRPGEARALLQRAPLSGPLAANRTLYVEGLILRAEGDLPGAVEKFRAALADNPGLTLVRRDLALTLNAMGEDESAKHHLERLMAEAPDQQAAGSIKSFIDQIDSKRPYKISGYLSVAPSTNVNNGTKHDVIYTSFGVPLTPDNMEESGVGVAAGLNAGYTKPLSEQVSAVIGGGLNARLYEDGEFSQLVASQSAELRYGFLRGHVGLGAIASQVWAGQRHDLAAWTIGPRVSGIYRFSPHASLQSTSTIEFKTYPESEYYDGYTAGEILQGTYAFDQATVGFATGGFEYTDTDYDNLDSNAYIAGLGVYRELPFGISVTADARLRFTDYLDDWGAIGKPRHDIRYDASVTVQKRDWAFWGYAPEIEYSYSRNDSNVMIYETEGHSVDLRLTKDF
jgi:outer membrane protein